MSYKPHATGVTHGIVYFGSPAGDNVFEAESNFSYNPSTDTLSAVNGSFTGDVTVLGDLNVSGVVNQVNTSNLLVEDVEITLRSGFTGTPDAADDASIIVNRGASTDAKITWDEGNTDWTFDYGGTGPYSIIQHIIDGEGIVASDASKRRTLALDISNLSTTVTSISNTDLIAIHDGSATKKIAYSDFVSSLTSTDVTLNAAVTDVLSISTQEISAVDNNADAVVGWDDTAGKLTYFSAATARAAIGVDAAGTDNSTDVTLAAGRDYLTISGQEITLGEIDISDDTNLAVDGTTITLTGDTLSVTSGGIDTTQLADGAVTEAKVTRTITEVSANSTISNDVTLVTTGATDKTVTLPTAAEGKVVVIKKKDSGAGNVVVVGATHDSVTDTIDGASSKRLYYVNESMTCIAKNTGTSTDQQAWYII